MKSQRIKYYLQFLFYFSPIIIFSQENATISNSDSVYSFVDQAPEFPGGVSGLGNYLNLNLFYPEQALNDSIEGKIYVGFIVEKDGSISNVKLLRGIGGGCDEEALRVITEMPEWNPGRLNGIPVRVSKTLPVTFSLATVLPSQTKIYLEADTLPSFIGGTKALYDYLGESISNYERILDSTLVDATVNVYFVVETDGSISNITVKDSVGFGLDENAIRIVKNMPKWIPGKIANTNVRVLLLLPVDFNVYQVVENQPEFPGGMNQLYVYLQKNVKYPIYAHDHNIQGRVFINFVIEADGTVSNAKVIRGVHKELDEEALRVVKKMPKWKPGIQRGKPVRVSFNLPIKFSL